MSPPRVGTIDCVQICSSVQSAAYGVKRDTSHLQGYGFFMSVCKRLPRRCAPRNETDRLPPFVIARRLRRGNLMPERPTVYKLIHTYRLPLTRSKGTCPRPTLVFCDVTACTAFSFFVPLGYTPDRLLRPNFSKQSFSRQTSYNCGESLPSGSKRSRD